MNEFEKEFMLNEVAIYLTIRFLKRRIKKAEDILKYRFDLPQFEIDLCKAIDNLLSQLNCSKHLAWTGIFTCRGRSTVDRNTKKHPK